jgi:hypothetical protein
MEQRRRVVAGLAGTAFVLIGIGVAAVVFDAGASGDLGPSLARTGTTTPRPNSPSASASPTLGTARPTGTGIPHGTPSPMASSSAIASSGPSQYPALFVAQGSGFAYETSDGSLISVMPVPGLQVFIERGRAIYRALPSNRYGLADGDYAGEFMPLVTMGQADGSSAETGGIVLSPPVATVLINDKLASIQSQADRWIVALPVDIRAEGKTPVDVSFDQFGLAGYSNTPRVIVRFSGSMPVVEANPSNGGYHVLVEELGVTSWQVIDPVRLALPGGAIDPDHAMNQLLIYGSGAADAQRDVMYDRHAAMGQTMLSASGDVSVSLVNGGAREELGPDKVLSVNNVPVFVAQN